MSTSARRGREARARRRAAQSRNARILHGARRCSSTSTTIDADRARGDLRARRRDDPGARLRSRAWRSPTTPNSALRRHLHHQPQARDAFQAQRRGRHGDGQSADRGRRLSRAVRRPQRDRASGAREQGHAVEFYTTVKTAYVWRDADRPGSRRQGATAMILISGEALIDLIPDPDQGQRPIRRGAGRGSPYNVAIGLARLGAQTAFVSRLSADGMAKRSPPRSPRAGVDLELCRARPAPDDARLRHARHRARRDRAILSTSTRPLTTASGRSLQNGRKPRSTCMSAPFRRSSAPWRGRRRSAAPRASPRDGELRSQHPPAGDPGSRIGREAGRAAGFPRPPRQGERGGPRVALSRPRIEDTLAAWAKRGPEFCVATLGEQGARSPYLGGAAEIAAPLVEVVDTVGAGDSFMSALLSAMDRDGALGAGASTRPRAAGSGCASPRRHRRSLARARARTRRRSA
jgi:fructokinase